MKSTAAEFIKKTGTLFIVMTLGCLNAFALTGIDNWNEIRSSRDVMIQQPTFAGAFGTNGLFNVCTTDDEFKSINPVKTCLEYREVIRHSESGMYKDYTCVNYETKAVSISRTYIQNVCVRHAPMTNQSSGECVEYASVTSVYPTSFSFAVIEASGEEYGDFLFSKTFALKTCE
ncbi:MAG: hypothetical protein H7177_14495 [Rhizobacter sp.]|nr:hypothetical protein [Bacteriovorax sp.]